MREFTVTVLSVELGVPPQGRPGEGKGEVARGEMGGGGGDLQRGGDIAGNDALSKTLHHSCLAHARLADDHGIVLGAAA